jgi:anti-sigma regulatory factor (Ser/Thr protein kinase)
LTAVEITLPPDRESPRRARRLVEKALPRDATEVVEVVTLLVSEMVTNAVLHAGTEVVLRIGHEGTSVRVEVTDGSATMPGVREVSDDSATGRGMWLVEELADAWGQQSRGDGKVVWFEVALEPDPVECAP